MQKEKIAVIDLGTNTFHMLIAEVGDRDDFVIRGKFKEEVHLGQGGLESGLILPDAFERGIQALKGFRKLIESGGITQVFAFATSAIRSATNGKAFVAAAREAAGIEVQVINGNTEAALIHEGVKNGVQLPAQTPSLLVDMGGGSVEFIVSQDRQPLLLRSLNLGGERLLSRIGFSGTLSIEQIATLKQCFDEELSGLIQELKEFDLSLLVGSSGTFENLAAMVAHRRGDYLSAENLNGYLFHISHFREIALRLLRSTPEERLAIPGMDPQKAHISVPGAALILYLTDRLAIESFMVSTSALKEGILFRYLREKRQRVNRFIGPTEQNLRARAVQQLAEKYQYNQSHALKVSELSSQLFEQLAPLHHLGPAEQEMLQYAAVLHDIGHFIQPSGHHKHGQYIIMNSNPYGFSTNELVLLANLVRYHRKSLPSREHYHFTILPDREKEVIFWLSGILRIADGLDRGHRNVVDQVRVHWNETHLYIQAEARDEASKEIAYAESEKAQLEAISGLSVMISQTEKGEA